MSSKPLVQCLLDDIEDTIKKYRDSGITMAETIASLEIAKLDLYHEMVEDDEEDNLL